MFSNDYDAFVGNSVFQNACCMCILQIGELCKVISEELRMQEQAVPWKEWCGIRGIFTHQYSNLDCQAVWDTIQQDLPESKTERGCGMKRQMRNLTYHNPMTVIRKIQTKRYDFDESKRLARNVFAEFAASPEGLSIEERVGQILTKEEREREYREYGC